MAPQLTTQQLAAAIRAIEQRRASKQLEVDSLNTFRAAAPEAINHLFPGPENLHLITALADASANYLTAKINWLLIDLQEIDLQLRALRQHQSGIVLARPVA